MVTLTKEEFRILCLSITDSELQVSRDATFPYKRTVYFKINSSQQSETTNFCAPWSNVGGVVSPKVGYRRMFPTTNFSVTMALPKNTAETQDNLSVVIYPSVPDLNLGAIVDSASTTYAMFQALWVPDSKTEAQYNTWLAKVAANKQALYNPSNWLFPANARFLARKPRSTRAIYLNDLMNYRQPFGPTSRQK